MTAAILIALVVGYFCGIGTALTLGVLSTAHTVEQFERADREERLAAAEYQHDEAQDE